MSMNMIVQYWEVDILVLSEWFPCSSHRRPLEAADTNPPLLGYVGVTKDSWYGELTSLKKFEAVETDESLWGEWPERVRRSPVSEVIDSYCRQSGDRMYGLDKKLQLGCSVVIDKGTARKVDLFEKSDSWS
jgi:hypothetical protein